MSAPWVCDALTLNSVIKLPLNWHNGVDGKTLWFATNDKLHKLVKSPTLKQLSCQCCKTILQRLAAGGLLIRAKTFTRLI